MVETVANIAVWIMLGVMAFFLLGGFCMMIANPKAWGLPFNRPNFLPPQTSDIEAEDDEQAK